MMELAPASSLSLLERLDNHHPYDTAYKGGYSNSGSERNSKRFANKWQSRYSNLCSG